MKRRPWAIIVLALIHVLAPVGNLLFNAWHNDRSLEQQWYYWFHVLPKGLLLLYLLVPVAAGICIYICKRQSYWAYLACLGILFVSNCYSFASSISLLNFLVLCLILIVDLLVVAYFMVPSVRKIYFDPRVRWWESAVRYVFSPEVLLNGQDKGEINNISSGGLFVKTALQLAENQALSLQWKYQGQEYKATGQVVYKNLRSQGYGIRFTPETEHDPVIKALISTLHKEGKILPDRLPGPEDSFIFWLKKLLTQGQGLFPNF